MQKSLFLISLLSLLLAGLSSCKNYKSEFEAKQKENALLQEEVKRFQQEEQLVKGEYSETIETLNAIEDTLNAIETREAKMRDLIDQGEVAANLSQKQIILERLDALRQANENSKNEAKRLQSKIQTFEIENEELRNLITQAEKKLTLKEAELQQTREIVSDLRRALNRTEAQLLATSGELEEAYGKLKSEKQALEAANRALEQKIEAIAQRDDFIEECARGYVACGTRKELRQADIVRKLNKNLTNDYREAVRRQKTFINFYKKNRIACNGGSILEILPERDPNSYSLTGDALIIEDSEAFWRVDKEVVLVLDK